MAKQNSEKLFLLEFLVDELNLEGKCSCMSPGEICVSFQFLDNECLDVCEGDFNGDKKFGEDSTVKTGKSCLFSLTPTQAQKAMQNFDIIVKVFKKMRPGCLPERSCVGSAQISVLPLFFDLINSTETATTAKVLQDTYDIRDTKGVYVGKVGVYIRMSCFGKLIITQFQMNMNDKSVLFKDKDGKSLYRYKKTKKSKANKIDDLPCPNQQQMSQCNRPPTCEQQQQQQQPQLMYPQQPQQFAAYSPVQGGGYSMNPAMFTTPNLNCPMQPCYPPPNLNCPTQPCFPDYGQPMTEMRGQHSGRGSRSRPRQSALKSSGCGGGCGRS